MISAELFIALQRLAPQHLISKIAGKIASSETPWLKHFIIKKFVAAYNVSMEEALNQNIRDYKSFNDFFTRELTPDARFINSLENTITSPADGAFSQLGKINKGDIFQAKGHYFNTQSLLGGDNHVANAFEDGHFATVYLSPKDYHRVHMPITGTLLSMTHIPGKLYSVNQTTAENYNGLFAKNERVACVFDTVIGPVAIVLVGAMIVGSIETVWAGQITSSNKTITKTYVDKDAEKIILEKGQEMGRFKLGSTAIILFPKNTVQWYPMFSANSPVKMGEAIGTINMPDTPKNRS